MSPMPTEEITGQYNELRNDILFLLELKIAQETLQFDIQALKHRVCILLFSFSLILQSLCYFHTKSLSYWPLIANFMILTNIELLLGH